MDFSLILFISVVLSGAIILLCKFLPTSRRVNSRNHSATNKPPVILDLARAIFPVILLVFLLRSFVVEPFRIPSGSMLSTLHIGDFILVNKYEYGIRLPILNKKVVDVNQPQRGDVLVFRYPVDPSLNFVKRVIGLPGDVISYENKRLSINGETLEIRPDGKYILSAQSSNRVTERFIETIDDTEHKILIDLSISDRPTQKITVPEGHYFVMGDNRDWSNDGRSWGFVPSENIVGKAFFIWFSWKGLNNGLIDWRRIGNSVN